MRWDAPCCIETSAGCRGRGSALTLRFGNPRSNLRRMRSLAARVRKVCDVRRDLTRLSVSRVAVLIFVRDYLRRSRPRVQIAKAAITSEYVAQMVARLEREILTVPIHGACPDVNNRAPGGIAISSARRSPKRHRRGERSNAKRQFRYGFCHEGASVADTTTDIISRFAF